MTTERRAASSALEAARRVSAGDDVPWRGLEVAAFSGHPPVQEGLDPHGRWPRVQGRPWLARPGVAPALFVGVGFLPLVGLVATAARGWWFDESQDGLAAAATGGAFALTALVLVALLVLVAVGGRGRREVGGRVALFAVPGVLALVTLPAAPVWWADGVGDTRLLPVWSTLVLAVVGVVAATVAKPARAGVEPGPLAVPRAAAARLTAAEQEAVAADLRSAVDDLEARGVVPARLAERARAAPLALLAHEVSQVPRR